MTAVGTTRVVRWTNSFLRKTARDVGLLLISSVLFALAHPNIIFHWGLGPLAFVALAPVFFVIRRSGWSRVFIYGAIYGYTSYALYNYWLATFHPLSIIIVPVVYMGYLLVLFPLLKLSELVLPRYGYILQIFVWVSYEYIKSLGFLGYSYGTLGYSQYLWSDFIQISGVAGVWGVSFLVVAFSALLSRLMIESANSGLVLWNKRLLKSFIQWHRIPFSVFVLLFIGNITYGSVARNDYQVEQQWRVALIQQNIDPWRGGFYAYEQSLDVLLRLSDEALKQDPDIVIWSETSFVPGIDWHTRHRSDSRRYALVRRLKNYLERQTVPFVVGNDDGQLERTATGEKRVDYNAAILFRRGVIEDTYRKIHLVPFTESFPFKDQFPGIHQWLKDADTHFWKPGSEYVVFDSDGQTGNKGVSFSTLICFEDTFGYLAREFVRRGAEVLVNMSNDWWSQSIPAEMQHMMIGVFRAIENRRAIVRSTNGGITMIVDPDGRIVKMIEPFTASYLVGDVPVVTGAQTLYTRWGDWFGIAVIMVSILLVMFGLLRSTVLSRKNIAS